jgi:hypothetical protein
MCDQLKKNPEGLRVIQTARTEKAFNAAAKEGYRPLVKPVVPSEDICHMVAVFQDKVTGEIQLSGDFRYSPKESQEVVVNYRSYYPYNFPSPFAAYLIPPDLNIGDRVWLDDLIEDVVAVWGNQGYQPRLKHCAATWDGKDFRIHFDPKNDAPRWIG